jgi:hypothetical protein
VDGPDEELARYNWSTYKGTVQTIYDILKDNSPINGGYQSPVLVSLSYGVGEGCIFYLAYEHMKPLTKLHKGLK